MKLEKISERIFFSTIKMNLVTKEETNVIATGFFVSKSINKDEFVICLVASKELIDNSIAASLVFHEAIDQVNLDVNEKEKIHIRIGESDWKDMWFSSDKTNDFVIAPIMPIVNFIEGQLDKFCFLQPIDLTSISKGEQLKDISLSEDILFLTYPNEIIQEDEYMPVLGRAKLATALFKDFNGNPEFLIQSPDTSNTSGSPVFILNEGSFMTKNGQVLGNRFLFLGIMNGSISNGLARVIKANLLNSVVDEFVESLIKD
ncbi:MULTISPECIES: hypothetical protein [Acinetobacter]|jgi:hypothetical protein|uniref:hypothetical protein n=1 Tax=Acinetobacter TaxID=469 RepID=UPI0002D11508|nr:MULTISPECIES: hypothetical protein [Acinetobacter]EHU1267947.1 hypothetical protein [Acinetobacter baumannii]EHU1268528.1 hypothetical protein [Acinetobacter baumannii]EHU1405509.1 hypothetical protein [Acinetobacter baumannii]EHU1406154.1 hypothetical protein [Acinetobacter baumannii]EHU1442933.1 hypothetical protein [Acinetobacter baumannii]